MAGALVLKFGTDFADAQRSMSSLASNAVANMATVSTAALGAAKAMGGVGAAASGLSTAMNLLATYKVAMLALGAAVTVAGAAIEAGAAQVERLNEINRGAAAAGVSTGFFQAWESQAERFKATTKEMADALQKFQTAATSSISDKGERQASPLEAIVKNAIELKNIGQIELVKLQDAASTEDKIRIVIGLVKQLYDEARKTGDEQFALLGDKLAQSFGPKWAEISSAIRTGSLDMDGIMSKMRESGSIMDGDLNARARELNTELGKANAKLESGMKPFLEDIAKLGLDIQGGWVGTVQALATAVKAAGDLYVEVKGIVDKFNELPGIRHAAKALNYLSGQDQAADRARGGDALRYALEMKYGDSARPFKAGEMSGDDVARAAALDPRRIKDQKWTTMSPDYRQMLKAFGQGSKRGDDFEIDESGTKGGRAPRAAAAQIDQVETYIKSLKKQNATLGAEASAIGKSSAERERAIDLARAEEAAKERGAALTDAERQKIVELADAHAQLRAKIDDAARAKQAMNAQNQFFGDAAYGAVDGLIIQHKKLKDVLGDVARAFEQAALKSLLLGQGPLAALFGMAGKDGGLGGIFGALMGIFGTKAEGGFVGTGATTMAPFSAFAGARAYANGGAVGIIAHHGELVLNQAQQRNVADGLRGGGNQFSIVNYAKGIDVTPQVTPRGVQFMIHSSLAENNVQAPGMLTEHSDRSWT